MENFNFITLYSDTDKLILKQAEDSLDPRTDRVNEIIEYSKEPKIKIMCFANCTTFIKEADQRLGHDMIFSAKSSSPVTPLLVKDRKLNHHTLEVFNEINLNSQKKNTKVILD